MTASAPRAAILHATHKGTATLLGVDVAVYVDASGDPPTRWMSLWGLQRALTVPGDAAPTRSLNGRALGCFRRVQGPGETAPTECINAQFVADCLISLAWCLRRDIERRDDPERRLARRAIQLLVDADREARRLRMERRRREGLLTGGIYDHMHDAIMDYKTKGLGSVRVDASEADPKIADILRPDGAAGASVASYAIPECVTIVPAGPDEPTSILAAQAVLIFRNWSWPVRCQGSPGDKLVDIYQRCAEVAAEIQAVLCTMAAVGGGTLLLDGPLVSIGKAHAIGEVTMGVVLGQQRLQA